MPDKKVILKLFSLIDLTTLEGSDTHAKTVQLANKAADLKQFDEEITLPAAICIYPVFVKSVKKALIGSGIKTASVAGGFPSGQTKYKIKCDEIKFALDEGADEIDAVISRGKFLEADYNAVHEEIAGFKELCGKVTLKIILETGELTTVDNIRRASGIAIRAGADFIKTSTGKSKISATPEAAKTMCEVIKDQFVKTGKKVGIKPSGGISELEDALIYFHLVEKQLGKDWLNPSLFRIGASRLANQLLNSYADEKGIPELKNYF